MFSQLIISMKKEFEKTKSFWNSLNLKQTNLSAHAHLKAQHKDIEDARLVYRVTPIDIYKRYDTHIVEQG